jgi:hypothetical protein
VRAAVRLAVPVLLVYAFATIWPCPWSHYPLSVATIAAVLSGARGLYGLRRPAPRLAELAPQAALDTKRLALWGGLGMLGLGLGLYWVCTRILVPFPPGISWAGTVLDFYMETAAGMVVLAYVSVVLIYVGISGLVRLADLATDHQ